MRIGVLADTHDRLPTLRLALERFANLGVDALLHAGDIVSPFAAKLLADWLGTLHVVYGNNDGERRGLRRVLPQIQDGPLLLALAERHVLLHHDLSACAPEHLAGADVIVTGHTHVATIEQRVGKLFVNPGECCGWISGQATIAVIDLDRQNANLIEVPT